MLYMFLALAAPAGGGEGMAGMNMGGPAAMATLQYPALAGVFTVLLIGYSAWAVDQLSARRFSLAAGPAASGPRPAARAFLLTPATQVSCQVVLGIAMALMLVIMI
jgi:hypothetical protein